MANYITIDGGTTNTRICLVVNGKVLDYRHYNIGAKNGIDDKLPLISVLKSGIAEILKQNNLTEKEVEAVLASGMITSEFGLVELPHIALPVGVKELKENMYNTTFPEICGLPFWFVRGVKAVGDNGEIKDVIRGEETELMGILNGAGIYVLPGSHSKIITVNEKGLITDFATMLTGEMISALSQNTILKGAIDLQNATLDPEFLQKGYFCAKEQGINAALFKVRIVKNFLKATNDQAYSFFLGAVLCQEIEYILSMPQEKIIIGGKALIKKPMEILLTQNSDKNIIALDEKITQTANANGLIKIFEYK